MNDQNALDHICLIAVKSPSCLHVHFNLPLGIMFVNCVSLCGKEEKGFSGEKEPSVPSFPLFPQEAKVTSRGT